MLSAFKQTRVIKAQKSDIESLQEQVEAERLLKKWRAEQQLKAEETAKEAEAAKIANAAAAARRLISNHGRSNGILMFEVYDLPLAILVNCLTISILGNRIKFSRLN